MQRIGFLAIIRKKIRNADAPTVVDHPHAVVDHRLPARVGHAAIQPEELTVGRAVIVVIDADDLRIKGDAVHAGAVTVGTADTGNVDAVVT
ncbi:hypothetical protein D3C78_1706160 [compost metagenome]